MTFRSTTPSISATAAQCQNRRRRRPALEGFGLRFLRRMRPGLPGGRPGGKRCPLQSPPLGNRKVRTTCSYCGVGCQMDLHVKTTAWSRSPAPRIPPPTTAACASRGVSALISSIPPERLTTPLIKENGKFREAVLGRSPRSGGQPSQRDQRRSWPRQHRRAHLGPGHQRGKLSLLKNSPGRCLKPTTSTIAPVSDIAPPWPVWPQLSEVAQ